MIISDCRIDNLISPKTGSFEGLSIRYGIPWLSIGDGIFILGGVRFGGCLEFFFVVDNRVPRFSHNFAISRPITIVPFDATAIVLLPRIAPIVFIIP